ncbi:MAG: hypothetical protein KAI47_21030 [Deltaproteobacteria bacterium]|nr:hypothetical protein [Deltaproteobacteria bacterium]
MTARNDDTKRARLDALEAEVARLRQEFDASSDPSLAPGGAKGGRDGSREHEETAGPEDEASRLFASFEKKKGLKALFVAAGVLAIALALIFGIFSALSSGFDAFAGDVAEKFVPGADEAPRNAVGGAHEVRLTTNPGGVGERPATTRPGPARAKGPAKAKARPPIQVPGI